MREVQSTVTAAVSCDGGISVLNHCLSWSKFVNIHLSHSRQWFNIHLSCLAINFIIITCRIYSSVVWYEMKVYETVSDELLLVILVSGVCFNKLDRVSDLRRSTTQPWATCCAKVRRQCIRIWRLRPPQPRVLARAAGGGARWCGGTGRPPKGGDTFALALFFAGFNFFVCCCFTDSTYRPILLLRSSFCF